jgi:hypothetical protein
MEGNTTMKYTKPVVISLGDALSIVHGSIHKEGCCTESPDTFSTVTAYEADE